MTKRAKLENPEPNSRAQLVGPNLMDEVGAHLNIIAQYFD